MGNPSGPLSLANLKFKGRRTGTGIDIRHSLSEEPRLEDGKNPWLYIPATDYEGHMGPKGVNQLSALDRLFHQAYVYMKPKALAMLGCATGGGLDHIDLSITRRIVGVDINPEYLEIARQRFDKLGSALELICAPLETLSLTPAGFDLIFAGLIFEYLEPEPLMHKIAAWLAPGGMCAVVLQLPSTATPTVTPSEYDSLQSLTPIMRLVPPLSLERMALGAGLELNRRFEVSLRFSKRFFVAWFSRI
jgi:SAM-dependent methyltransferase